MLLQTTARKIILAFIAALLLITTGKDWYDFYSCGAVDACFTAAGTLQLYTKFSISILLTVFAFIISRDSFSKLDAKLLRLAFIFSLLADFCFNVIKIAAPDQRLLSNILGIAFFIMFQTVLIHRHTRTSESDTNPGKVHKFLLLPLAGFAGALFGGGVVEFTLGNVMLVTVAVYAVFLITSLVVALLVSRNSYFPAASARLIRWGLVLFFIGDALVGLALMTGEDHSTLQAVAEVANNFVWWTYVPAQLMLIASCRKSV